MSSPVSPLPAALPASRLAELETRGYTVLPPSELPEAVLADAAGHASRLPAAGEGGAASAADPRLKDAAFEHAGAAFSGSPLSRRAFMMGMGPRRRDDPQDWLWGRRARRAAGSFDALPLPGPGPAQADAERDYPGYTGPAEGRFNCTPAQAYEAILAVGGVDELRVLPGSHARAAERRALLSSHGAAPGEPLYEELLPPAWGRPADVRLEPGSLLIMHGDLLRQELPAGARERSRLRLRPPMPAAPAPAPEAPAPGPGLLRRAIQLVKLRLAHPLSRRLRSPLRMVNVGAGLGWSHPSCLALDQNPDVELSHDLSSGSGLPFEDGRMDAVYSSHCIEHLPESDVLSFLAECRRCLRPGGVLRLTCPDMDVAFDAYERRDLRFFDWRSGIYAWDGWLRKLLRLAFTLVVDAYSDEELRELHARLGRDGLRARLAGEQAALGAAELEGAADAHKSWWTPRRLEEALRGAGFADVRVCGRNDSRWPAFRDARYFDYSSPYMSLYVEAVRP